MRVCECVCVRSVSPSGHSLPVTSGQFALVLPLSPSPATPLITSWILTHCVSAKKPFKWDRLGASSRFQTGFALLFPFFLFLLLREARWGWLKKLFTSSDSTQGSLFTSPPGNFTVVCELCQIRKCGTSDSESLRAPACASSIDVSAVNRIEAAASSPWLCDSMIGSFRRFSSATTRFPV